MRFLKCALATTIAAVFLAGTAQAAPVTVGSPLTGLFESPGESSLEGTVLNLTVADADSHATSPVTGAVVRWHLLGAAGGPFRLRVLRPAGGPLYTAVGSSNPVAAATLGFETFATALPIQAGDTIGLDLVKGVKLGVTENPLSSAALWAPALAEGSTRPYDIAESGGSFGFNAEVQPQPTVTLVSPASGSFKGGSAVTIAGTDFAAVSSVRFGTEEAASFAVGSEGQITAVAPPGKPGTTDITVTTVAGTSPVTAADHFKYTACVVPKLKEKKLKAAKKKLRKAGCKPGKVTKKHGVTPKTGKVVGQSPKPGKTLKSGTRVNVTLG